MIEKYDKYKKEMKKLVRLSNGGNNDHGDYEMTHLEADKLLCKLLIELGYKEIVDLYEKVGKWYA